MVEAGAGGKTCFVMMPFENPFPGVYEDYVKPGIEAAGLDPEKGDSVFMPGRIMSQVWRMIQGADVCLAILTTKNANVFYELGMAHAIGKPVVLVSETIEDVPFDLRDQRVISYDRNDGAWGQKLKQDIAKMLRNTLVNPKLAVPEIFVDARDRLARLEEQAEELRRQHAQPVHPLLLDDFRTMVRRHQAAEDVEEVAQASRDAVRGGLPRAAVEAVIRAEYYRELAEEILQEAFPVREQ